MASDKDKLERTAYSYGKMCKSQYDRYQQTQAGVDALTGIGTCQAAAALAGEADVPTIAAVARQRYDNLVDTILDRLGE